MADVEHRGGSAGPIQTLTATRNTDATTITVTWSESARATVGYEVQYRKNTGSWQRATTAAAADRTHTQTNAGGVETYTFRVRGVSGNGAGPWKESGTVAAPDNIGYYGADAGVDWFTLKVTRGPWWFDYRDHKADWSSCRQVSNGNVTLTNLRPEVTYLVDIYTSAGCSANKIVDKQSIGTLSETQHPDKCWNVADCRANDRPDDFNYHTHKRSYLGEVGVLLSGCNQGGKVSHNHTWPDGRGGWHWHCKTE